MDITEAKKQYADEAKKQYADEANDWLNLFEKDENLEKYREKIKDYDNKEIYGDDGKDLLKTIFEEDDINELYAIHSKYEKIMNSEQKKIMNSEQKKIMNSEQEKIMNSEQEISEKRTQLNNLKNEIQKNTKTIETLE